MSVLTNNVTQNTWIMSIAGVVLMVILCYISGRLHQWYKHSMDREDAYREGYNTATRSLFSLATRASAIGISRTSPTGYRPGIVRGSAPAKMTAEPVSGVRPPRHRAEDKTKGKPSSTKQYHFPELHDRQSV